MSPITATELRLCLKAQDDALQAFARLMPEIKMLESGIRAMRPGTQHGDYCIAQGIGWFGAGADEAARTKAIERLAGRVRRREFLEDRDRAVKARLLARVEAAREDGREGASLRSVRLEVLSTAIVLVIGEEDRVLTRWWGRGKGPRKRPAAPRQLKPRKFFQWFNGQVNLAYEAILLDEAYPPPDSESNGDPTLVLDCDQELAALADARPDILNLLVEREMLAEVNGKLSPEELALAGMDAAGLKVSEMARQLGIRPNAVSGRLWRLRDKAKRLFSSSA